MPEIGQSLSHYSVVEKIGKGGMGEVYRAKDQKLGRDVAIKVLPEEFARDADRVARFQREAKLLASLNHPNIAAIHGLEESGGTQFLVLELVEGETLADRVKRGPIPVEESLKLALQIAEALEAAHEKGVIHRDLKPANIKVTPDGKVKVLDFGLAKAFAGEQAELNLSNSPTLSDMATRQGVILGTAAYMSPEQARGKPVDKRTDIWAFGCVLYEMLTGRAAFQGEDVTEILASVVKGGANFDLLPANLHPRVHEAIARCLQKDLKRRYHDIADVRYEVEQSLAYPSEVSAQPVTAIQTRMRLRTILPWVAALVLTAIIAGVAVWKFMPTEPRQVICFSFDLPEDQQFSNFGIYAPFAVSPDGKQFVYSTPKGLYMRSIDALTAKPIFGSEGNIQNPFFSPDGKWIGYWSGADKKLKKISADGGTPIALCDITDFLGARWNEDNTIAYGRQSGDIMRISGDGGTPESVIKRMSRKPSLPQILPDGKSVLYTLYPMPVVKIVAQSLESGEPQELFRGVWAQYLPTGHIIYRSADSSSLFAVQFDPDRLKVTGEPVAVLEYVRQYAVSESGTLAYVTGGRAAAATKTLVWVNRKGEEEPLSAAPDLYSAVRISPDGTRVASTIGPAPKYHIWIWDMVRGTKTRLTLDEFTDNLAPLWTLDGKRIVYASSRENLSLSDLYWKASDGTGDAEKLASSPGRGLFPSSWSKDGKILALLENIYPLPEDIGMLSMEGARLRKPLLQEKYSESQPQISPDGRWIAYVSDESGASEVYVRPFPEVNKGKAQVSTSGGDSPLWSPDARELYYRSGDAVMMVPVESGPAFKPGKATVLFQGTYSGTGVVSQVSLWDISPDGKRFLMMKEIATEAPRKINVVVNWFEELKQRVPTK